MSDGGVITPVDTRPRVCVCTFKYKRLLLERSTLYMPCFEINKPNIKINTEVLRNYNLFVVFKFEFRALDVNQSQYALQFEFKFLWFPRRRRRRNIY